MVGAPAPSNRHEWTRRCTSGWSSGRLSCVVTTLAALFVLVASDSGGGAAAAVATPSSSAAPTVNGGGRSYAKVVINEIMYNEQRSDKKKEKKKDLEAAAGDDVVAVDTEKDDDDARETDDEEESPDLLGGDWVELLNAGEDPVDVTGWTFRGLRGSSVGVFEILPPSPRGEEGGTEAKASSAVIIPAGGYLVLARNITTFAERYPELVAANPDVVANGSFKFNLSAKG